MKNKFITLHVKTYLQAEFLMMHSWLSYLLDALSFSLEKEKVRNCKTKKFVKVYFGNKSSSSSLRPSKRMVLVLQQLIRKVQRLQQREVKLLKKPSKKSSTKLDQSTLKVGFYLTSQRV
jgi:hypothetical protein